MFDVVKGCYGIVIVYSLSLHRKIRSAWLGDGRFPMEYSPDDSTVAKEPQEGKKRRGNKLRQGRAG
ncbi:hypothetical protein KTAU_11010 [Thermogemmatispora aurantia]|uniref:Uncharacterized protein n=1 Tax=Thermogemmatispora aurantia TaxID=2045279 RepID=A0A5J4JZN8_9CHLR|nr:hypothetical protein KTAU_11010 [Thermogemmatispora aurantia]